MSKNGNVMNDEEKATDRWENEGGQSGRTR
jgi:hypothetical protein